MTYTIAQAAQACAVNRSTVLRALRAGRISGHKDAAGTWFIEPAELHRIFPPAQAAPMQTPQDAQADALLVVKMLREQIADLKDQRDKWEAIASRLALPAPSPRTWWWRR